MSAIETNNSQLTQFSTGFNDEFFRVFGKNPDEMSHSPVKNTMGKMDATYLGHLIISGKLDTWIHVANMNLPLAHNMAHFQDTYENILAYFSNPEFTQWDFMQIEEENKEIVQYLMDKFAKADILIYNTSKKISI